MWVSAEWQQRNEQQRKLTTTSAASLLWRNVVRLVPRKRCWFTSRIITNPDAISLRIECKHRRQL